MKNALETYILEVNELLVDLESALLILENNPTDKLSIENVFRVMHTLKGNSSMFGFNVISDIVHELETVYDKVRSNQIVLDKNLLNCTLEVLDHLKKIIDDFVHDPEMNDLMNKKNQKKILKKVSLLLEKDEFQQLEDKVNEVSHDKSTFYIQFEPHENFFEDGSNPLILIKELSTLGFVLSVPHFKSDVSFEVLDFTKNHTYWEIYLESSASKKEIKDVFVFAEFNATIEIIELRYTDLVRNTEFVDFVSQHIYKDHKFGSGDVLTIAQSVGIPILNESEALQKPEFKKEKSNKSISSIRVSSDKLDELMNLVSELITTQAGLTLYAEKLKDLKLEGIAENIEKLSRRLRDVSFGMTLIPIKSLQNRFQRMIRDTSQSLGKEISFSIEGGETELDKSIIESLSDPLMHILRNSMDHGIATPEVREKQGKSRKGRITLRAYYSGVFVYMQIIDDGQGINKEAVRKKAIEKAIISEEDDLDEKNLIDLIFHPGFSTAKEVTEVSGRGVGMDVVRKNIENIRGSVTISSEQNVGTNVTIKLPLTLSVIDGLLVEIDEDKYVIPLSVINKCYEVEYTQLENNFNQLLILDGEQIPFINLRNQFDYQVFDQVYSQIIVVNNEERKVGISVDNIIGEYQAVVKSVGRYYKNQPFVSGATILGDGTIALILETNKLIEMYQDNKIFNNQKNAINN